MQTRTPAQVERQLALEPTLLQLGLQHEWLASLVVSLASCETSDELADFLEDHIETAAKVCGSFRKSITEIEEGIR